MRLALTLMLLMLATGCCQGQPAYVPTTRPAGAGLSVPTVDPLLHAAVVPPLGWHPDPVKLTPNSRHQVWISPGKSTAYGVIAFHMPLPVGEGLALRGFLQRMQETEGESNRLDRRDDPALDGIRFVAEGGLYTIRGNLTTDGRSGWVVYAGTLRKQPVNDAELRLAEQAREATRVRLP
jgi:hypothetical protein